MNLLWCIHHYLDLRRKVEAGQVLDDPKVTVLFAAKAAPAYIIAQDIIHAILCLQDIIEHDPEVSKVFRVVMVDNYHHGCGEADSGLRSVRADFPCVQGGIRNRKHEIHAQRRGHDRNRGWRKR